MTYRGALGQYQRKRLVYFDTRRWRYHTTFVDASGHWCGWLSHNDLRLHYRAYWSTRCKHGCCGGE